MNEPKAVDAIDKWILRIVQKDASLSIREIATQVGLSQTACWKRLQRLDASGVIKRRIALLDPLKVGLGLTAFVSVQVGDHSGKAIARFAAEIAAMEEVMECYRMAGDVDYGLRVVVPDAAAFDIFYKRLIETIPLKNVTSRFALENVKSETAFPIACQPRKSRSKFPDPCRAAPPDSIEAAQRPQGNLPSPRAAHLTGR
jgi:Lrp/AsnC family transcriptional regulator